MNLTLIGRYFNEKSGGIGKYSKEILKKVIADENFVTTIVNCPKDGRIPYFFYTTLTLKYRLPKNEDVYHALSPLEGVWTPKEKTVTTFHDLIPWLHSEIVYPNRLVRIIAKNHFKLAAKKAAKSKKIICNSIETSEQIKKYLNVGEEKITVTRPGISSNLNHKEVKSNKVKIGSLSYMDPRKRFDLLIREFKKTEINAELVIGGRGKQYNKLQKLASDDDRIKLPGFIPEKNKNEFLNSLNCFIFPSKLEGYGIPIVEAMATKTPVITLEDAIMPKDIKNKTKIVKKENLSNLIGNLDFGSDLELEENFVFAKNHSWKKMVDKTVEVYKEVSN